MNKYKVKVSEHTAIIVTALNDNQAKKKAWNEIKDGFTYGCENKSQFMKIALVERAN